MRIPVRVVSQAEFDEWLAGQAKPEPTPGGTPTGEVTEVTIVAKNITFDLGEIRAPAGGTVHLTVDNQDGGVIHNWALYTSEDAANAGDAPLASTELEAGPVQQELTFTAPDAGEYFYRCDVHPTTMTGKFIAE
jgi:plastocyanin